MRLLPMKFNSRSCRSYILSCCCLLLLIALATPAGDATAQTATPTIILGETFTPTPSSTPAASGGCPGWYPAGVLTTRWLDQCGGTCLGLTTPTPVLSVPVQEVGAVSTLPAFSLGTAVPTGAPMATATATVTATPMLTPTPTLYMLSEDFEGVSPVASLVAWTAGTRGYVDATNGYVLRVDTQAFGNADAEIVIDFSSMGGVQLSGVGIVGQAAGLVSRRISMELDIGAGYVERYGISPANAALSTTFPSAGQMSGNVQRMRFRVRAVSNNGTFPAWVKLYKVDVNYYPLVVGSPTPTLSPTVTLTPSLTPTGYFGINDPSSVFGTVNCEVPEYVNDPIADVESGLTIHDVGCYTVVPAVFIGLPDDILGIAIEDFSVDQTDVCVTWYNMPALSILGLSIPLDWLSLIPVLWLLRRLYNF